MTQAEQAASHAKPADEVDPVVVTATGDAADPAHKPDGAARQWQEPEWSDVPGDGGSLPYEDFLSFRLGRLYTLVQRETSTSYMEPAGLSLPEWRVLARLASRPTVEMRELAHMSLMDKAAISRAVDSLLAKGLVARDVDPAHAKRRIVAITPSGRKLMRRMLPAAHKTQAAMLRLLDDEERIVLGRAITKLTNALSRQQAGSDQNGDTPS